MNNNTLPEWKTVAPKTEILKIEDFVENLKNKFPVLPAVENAYNKCL